jgi:hypothetical protein
MKKIISLLAVALFATTFAAGCGKPKTCAENNGKGEDVCQKADGYEGNLVCVWKGKDKTDKEGKCEAKPDAEICAAANADQAACDAATKTLGDKKKVCQFAEVAADADKKIEASKTCTLADKKN